MKININGERKPYDIGDLIELRGFGFRMIGSSNANQYFLISMEGHVTTARYDSIEELLEGRNIISHYKNDELEISLKKKKKLF